MSTKKFGVAIAGGSGYGAGELLRMLLLHPDIEVAAVTSRTFAGKPISAVHSHLQGLSDCTFHESLPEDWFSKYERSAVVCAMPSGEAVRAITDLLAANLPQHVSVLDLSGDLRLTERGTHEAFYPEAPFAEQIRKECRYGLPELHRSEIAQARFITNPGCLATAAILALAPLRSLQFVGSVVVDAKTGTSGAGREPQASMHHPSRAQDFTAYKALQHRHEPEILQALGESFAKSDRLMFIPHLIPTVRGIFVTVYGTTTEEHSLDSIRELYRATYNDAPFVRFRQAPPRLVDVVGTNFCDIHITARGPQVAVMATIDNLGKGMVGQCIQNLNIMWGLPEKTGLLIPSLGPA
jgi:N-acetyl-gamma-glutamyl-phosphate reductase